MCCIRCPHCNATLNPMQGMLAILVCAFRALFPLFLIFVVPLLLLSLGGFLFGWFIGYVAGLPSSPLNPAAGWCCLGFSVASLLISAVSLCIYIAVQSSRHGIAKFWRRIGSHIIDSRACFCRLSEYKIWKEFFDERLGKVATKEQVDELHVLDDGLAEIEKWETVKDFVKEKTTSKGDVGDDGQETEGTTTATKTKETPSASDDDVVDEATSTLADEEEEEEEGESDEDEDEDVEFVYVNSDGEEVLGPTPGDDDAGDGKGESEGGDDDEEIVFVYINSDGEEVETTKNPFDDDDVEVEYVYEDEKGEETTQ